MKFWKYVVAIFCVVLALFGLAEATGMLTPVESVVGELSLWRFALALFFLVYTVYWFIKRNVFLAFLSLALLFIELEPNIAYLCGVESGNLINNWTLLLCVSLIGFGLYLLLPKRRKKWVLFHGEGVHHDGPNGYHENSLGSRTIYIDCTTFTDRYVENNLGSTVIKFENPDAYIGGGLLRVENNLGSTVIDVPAKWNLDCQFENNLGHVQNHHGNGGDGPSLMIVGENNLGSVVIRKD